MTDCPKANRLTLFITMISNAERFASPITPMECLIVAHLASQWVETGDVPPPEEWDKYDYEIDDAIEEAAHATKN